MRRRKCHPQIKRWAAYRKAKKKSEYEVKGPGKGRKTAWVTGDKGVLNDSNLPTGKRSRRYSCDIECNALPHCPHRAGKARGRFLPCLLQVWPLDRLILLFPLKSR